MSEKISAIGKPFCSISDSSNNAVNGVWMSNNTWVGNAVPGWVDSTGVGTGSTTTIPQYYPNSFTGGVTPPLQSLRREPTEEELKDPVFADLWEKFKLNSFLDANHILQILEVVKPYFDALEEANRILAHPKKEQVKEDETIPV